MKKLFNLFFAFILFSSLAQCQFFKQTIDYPIIGPINNELFLSSSGWTVSGTNDFTFSNKLSISGANTSTYDKYITKDNSYQNFRLFTWDIYFTVKDVGSTSNGFGIGFKSVNTYLACDRFLEINTKNGIVSVYADFRSPTAGNASVLFTGATNLNCSLNDQVHVTYDVYNSTGYLTVFNLTTGTKAVYSSIQEYNPNTSKLAVWSLGGAHQIDKVIISTNSRVCSDILFIGNSITTAGVVGNQALSFPAIVGAKFNNYSVCSGNGDRTTEVLLSMPNILKLKPKIAIILLGTNDAASGISTTAFTANFINIKSQLNAIGTVVYFCKILPRGNAGFDPFNTTLSVNIPSQYLIDTYTSLKGTGIELAAAYDCGDGLHPNAAGHAVIANLIKSKLGLLINTHSIEFEEHYEYIRTAA